MELHYVICLAGQSSGTSPSDLQNFFWDLPFSRSECHHFHWSWCPALSMSQHFIIISKNTSLMCKKMFAKNQYHEFHIFRCHCCSWEGAACWKESSQTDGKFNVFIINIDNKKLTGKIYTLEPCLNFWQQKFSSTLIQNSDGTSRWKQWSEKKNQTWNKLMFY